MSIDVCLIMLFLCLKILWYPLPPFALLLCKAGAFCYFMHFFRRYFVLHLHFDSNSFLLFRLEDWSAFNRYVICLAPGPLENPTYRNNSFVTSTAYQSVIWKKVEGSLKHAIHYNNFLLINNFCTYTHFCISISFLRISLR